MRLTAPNSCRITVVHLLALILKDLWSSYTRVREYNITVDFHNSDSWDSMDSSDSCDSMDSSDSIRACLTVFTFSWNPAAQDPSGQNWAPPQEPQLLPAWISLYHIKYFHLISYLIISSVMHCIISVYKNKIILYCIIFYHIIYYSIISYCNLLYHIIPCNIFSYSFKWLSFRSRHQDGCKNVGKCSCF